MSVNTIATRYAKSLLDLSIEQNTLDVVHGDVVGLDKALENRDLQLLIKSPIVNTSKKKEVMAALFGGKLSETVMAFINIIISKGRETAMPQIVKSFLVQYRDLKKVSQATLITAEKLDDETFEAIRKKLLDSNFTKEQVELTTEIDPTIIGGYIVKIGDKLYDASVAHQLKRLRKELIA